MTETGPLPRVQVWQQMDELQDWELDERALKASYRFGTTATALEFIALIGLVAEQINHHPTVDWRYEAVHVAISLRSIHGVTQLDFNLAARISDEAAKLEGLAIKGNDR